MRTINRRIAGGAAAAGVIIASLIAGPTARADPWPQRTVRIIVPGGAGQGQDVPARMFAQRLAERWKQPVVVENRPGAEGLIGTAAFANMRDDHALLFWVAAVFTLYPLLQEKLPYDPSDIVPISAATNGILTVSASNLLQANSVRAVLEAAHGQPGKLNFSTGAGELPYFFSAFLRHQGVDLVAVPYRDTNLAIQDLGEGRLDILLSSLVSVLPLAQVGKVKLLVVTNRNRAAAMPQIPTATEAGFPDLTFDGLAGFFGARDIPAGRSERIAADVRAAAADPILAERLTAIGMLPFGSTPSEFAAAIEQRRTMMTAAIKLVDKTPGQ